MIAYTEKEAYEVIKQNKHRLIGKPMFPNTTDEKRKNIIVTEMAKEEVLPNIFRVVCTSETNYQQEFNTVLSVNGMANNCHKI